MNANARIARAMKILPNSKFPNLKIVLKASATSVASEAVSAAPVVRSITPDVRIVRAVIEQTMIVSAKTSKMPQRPCLTGSLTLELLWTITDEPRPASFEKTPLLHPCVIIVLKATPVAPPQAACFVNAMVKIALKAGRMPL